MLTGSLMTSSPLKVHQWVYNIKCNHYTKQVYVKHLIVNSEASIFWGAFVLGNQFLFRWVGPCIQFL